MNERQWRVTAYHEAGHAVAAWALGARLHRVTITPGQDYAGRVSRNRSLPESTLYGNPDYARLRMEREIKIALAGAIAQRRAFPHSYWRAGAHTDERNIGEILVCMYPSERKGDDGWRAREYWRQLLKIETRWLLDRYWHCVDALAEYLLRHPTLTGHEAKDVIAAAFAHQFADTPVAPTV